MNLIYLKQLSLFKYILKQFTNLHFAKKSLILWGIQIDLDSQYLELTM